MTLPKTLFTRYLNRFDELISEGEKIQESVQVITGREPDSISKSFGGRASMKEPDKYRVDRQQLKRWTINCTSLLDQVIPPDSIYVPLIKKFGVWASTPPHNLDNEIAILTGIKEDFERGFFDDLGLQIEAEIASDYMGQAEKLLTEGQTGKYDHVPAAVLAGAVLEKELRTLCLKQNPPVLLEDTKGKPLTMNRLIEDLKKAKAFNEVKAKQLRVWAGIRNKAAHGEFDQFNRGDVEPMIKGIHNFLADYLQ